MEQVAECKRLVPSGVPTPDWRLMLRDGRVADVEVTSCPDEPGLRLFKAAQTEDWSPKEWPDAGLSHEWTVVLSDRSARFSKRPSPKQLAAALCATLAAVEATCATPKQMAAEATRRLAAPAHFLHQYGGWEPLTQAFLNQETHESTVDFIADWCSKHSGYWLPELLKDHIVTGYGDYGPVHVDVIGEPRFGRGRGRER